MLDNPKPGMAPAKDVTVQMADDIQLDATSRTLVDLFAGCGGLSLGMEQSGFRPLHVNELNDDARATYLANRNTPENAIDGEAFGENPLHYSSDVGQLLGDDKLDELLGYLGESKGIQVQTEGAGHSIDLVAGGPPCQGFSRIGHRRSYATDRRDIAANQLYRKMAAVISRVGPRLFLFENVTGIRNAKWTLAGDGDVWTDVLAAFSEIPGYEVRYSIVHAKDYGVPQNRPRVLLVGIRDDVADALRGKTYMDPNTEIEVSLNLAAKDDKGEKSLDAVACGLLPGAARKRSYPDLRVLLGDLVDPDYEAEFLTTRYPSKYTNKIQKALRTRPDGAIMGKGDLVSDHVYSRHTPRVLSRFQHMVANEGKIPSHLKTKKFSQRWLPPTWEDREPFMTVTSLPDDYVHFEQPRILTVREWARLQCFPDWYEFKGKRTTGGLRRAGNPREGIYDRELPKYTQIGNAVPVKLAKIVGEHFDNLLTAATG